VRIIFDGILYSKFYATYGCDLYTCATYSGDFTVLVVTCASLRETLGCIIGFK